MMRFLGGTVLALVFLLAGYLLEGGNLVRLLALTPFLITFFVPVFGVLAIWTFKDWGQAWRRAFSPEGSDRLRSIELWKFFEFASYLAGGVALLVGGILILGSGLEAGVKWNQSLSFALTAPLYGGVLGLVARILRARIGGQE